MRQVTPTSTDVPTARRVHEGIVGESSSSTMPRTSPRNASSRFPARTIPPCRRPVVTQLQDYYAALGVPAQNVSTIELANAGHTMPTLNYGVACAKTESPFIGKCQVDGAKAILGWIYGPDPLAPPAATTPKGRYIRFDQTRYLPADRPSSFTWTTGMDTTGWLYVPAACNAGAPCRLHIVLHGCEQGQDYLPLDVAAGWRPLLRHDVRAARGLCASGRTTTGSSCCFRRRCRFPGSIRMDAGTGGATRAPILPISKAFRCARSAT